MADQLRVLNTSVRTATLGTTNEQVAIGSAEVKLILATNRGSGRTQVDLYDEVPTPGSPTAAKLRATVIAPPGETKTVIFNHLSAGLRFETGLYMSTTGTDNNFIAFIYGS